MVWDEYRFWWTVYSYTFNRIVCIPCVYQTRRESEREREKRLVPRSSIKSRHQEPSNFLKRLATVTENSCIRCTGLSFSLTVLFQWDLSKTYNSFIRTGEVYISCWPGIVTYGYARARLDSCSRQPMVNHWRFTTKLLVIFHDSAMSSQLWSRFNNLTEWLLSLPIACIQRPRHRDTLSK